ncbi:S41 family peptidase [Streptomyces sp. NPDC005963]|uniref:S41 family peptidase n=1 Tax=Streptomyces sp. NPDC005963 TaxID=3156721 RepID=UPI00340CFC0E
MTSVTSSGVAEDSERRRTTRRQRNAARPVRRGVITAAGTVLALAGSIGTAVAAPVDGQRSTTSERSTGTTPNGFWRMDGYGMVVGVRDGVLRAWETTAISCQGSLTAQQQGTPAADGSVRYGVDGLVLTVRARAAQRATLSIDGSVGTRGLRRIAALPALCGQPQATGPVATFDVFWQTFKENYAFFARRGVDWDAMRATHRPKVHSGTTDRELFDILSEMVAPLQDAHVSLDAATPELTRSFRAIKAGTVGPTQEYDDQIRAFIERRDLGGTRLQEYAQGAIGYADLPGGLGYLRINRFVAYSPDGGYENDSAELDRALDEIVTRARTSGRTAWRGLIVDVRVNAGGSDGLGLQIAARLTDRVYTAYAKQVRNDPDDDTRFTPRQKFRVVPAVDAPRYTGPIALLTAGSTVSAGETFTKALAERPLPTTLIGENTQGILSDVHGRTLPNGWQLGLSNEKYTTPRGVSYEGPGISPDVRTPVFTDAEFAADRDSAFDRAKALLTRRR